MKVTEDPEAQSWIQYVMLMSVEAFESGSCA